MLDSSMPKSDYQIEDLASPWGPHIHADFLHQGTT